MADTQDINKLENKIDNLALDVSDIKLRLDGEMKDMKLSMGEIDNRLDGHSECIRQLRQWGLGNGGPGAEERLRSTERFVITMDKANVPNRLGQAEAHIETLQRIADSAILEGVQGAVNDTLDKRDRTAIAKVKAWGPIIAAMCAATGAVLAAVL